MDIKRRVLITGLVAAVLLSGGAYAYTYTTGFQIINVGEPSGDVATSNVPSGQPDWNSVTDNLSENTTCGEVPTGDLYDITPNASYSGDILVDVYLTNAANLTRAYKYFNMKLYLDGSDEAAETPSYRVLSLENGRANFSLGGITSSGKSWTQTTQSDFEGGTLNQVDTTTCPDDVLLAKFTDNVTDSYDDQSKIASSVNVTISGGQVSLDYAAGTPATETLRPTADGDETGIEYPASPPHWTEVDDVTPDGDSTYVSTELYQYQEDLYNIANHTAGTGQINYVRVYMLGKEESEQAPANGYVHIKTNGVEYNGTAVDFPINVYATYSYQWNNNPQTGNPWTWSEIDDLQIGVGLMYCKPNQWSRVTQVYAEINYTPLSYSSPGTLTSTNLLPGETVFSIDDFYYDASAVPSGTSLKVQYSTDNSTWYNSSGTPGGWDTLSQGSANISLSGLSWSGANFYYNMEFTSDGSDTPVLDEIRVYFSTYYTSGDLTSSSHDGGDYGN